jgi:hypothetical protein
MEARWNIKVDEDLDRELRIHLAERGLKRGALSRFVEEAVREKLFRVSVEEVKKRNAEYPPEEVEAAVAEAVSEARRAGSPRH